MPCAFSGLSDQALGGADPMLLAAAIVFATAVIRHLAIITSITLPAFLRPPLRGPPAIT
jgi:hypothetical protein